MLQVADVCPRCGLEHADSRSSGQHLRPDDCPAVAHGSFPVLRHLLPTTSEIPPNSAARRIQEYEQPASATTISGPVSLSWGRRGEEQRGRPLSIPWLPLPDLGEVL